MTASTGVDETAYPPTKLTIDNKHLAYKAEKQSRIDAKALDRVPKNITAALSNIIKSHVVYRRKVNGTLKARPVPWRRRDLKKNRVRGSAPSLSLDSLRLLFFLAAEHRWFMKKTDVKEAYLQANELSWEVSIQPPQEQDDEKALWKFLVPA